MLRADCLLLAPRGSSVTVAGWPGGGDGAASVVGPDARLPCPEAVRGELHTAVADLAGVAAWMSFDGLAHNDSRRLFRVAVGCLGDHDWYLRAMLLCDMARQEIWCGDPDTGP
jgi:hypothetical protein